MSLNALLWPGLITLIAVMMAAIPWLTRREIYFAVTVDPGLRNTRFGARCYASYLAWVVVGWVGGMAALIYVTAAAWRADATAVALTGAALAPILSGLAGFLRVRRHLLPCARSPARMRTAPLAAGAEARLVPGPAWAHVAPYGLLLAAAAALALGWEAIPGRFPQQLQADGSVGRWAHKSVWTVFATPFWGLLTAALMHAAMLIGRLARRQPDQSQRTRAINAFLLILLNLFAVALAYLALLPLFGPRLVFSAAGSITLACLLLAMLAVPLVAYWRRIRAIHAQPVREIGDRTPDRAWKLGLVYFNPDDPALWVEKRFGVGWTVNFARPGAWLFIAGILALGVGGLAIST